jgi:hypothetical protein
MLADERFSDLYDAYEKYEDIHHQLYKDISLREIPGIMYALAYQDGLKHAFEYLLQNAKKGTCSDPHRLYHVVESYESIRKDKVRSKRYDDAAYIEGYVNGILYLLASDEERGKLPYYYVYGRGPVLSQEEFLKMVKYASSIHKGAYAYAEKWASKLGEGVAYHHIPFID